MKLHGFHLLYKWYKPPRVTLHAQFECNLIKQAVLARMKFGIRGTGRPASYVALNYCKMLGYCISPSTKLFFTVVTNHVHTPDK